MPDIDFLSSPTTSSGDGDQNDDKKKKASQDMQMHVPDALVKKDEFVPEKMHAAKKDKEDEKPSDFLHPHDSGVRVEPPKPKTPPPAPAPKLSVPPPPKSPAPKPSPAPPKSPPLPPKPPVKPPTPPPKLLPPEPPSKKEGKGSTLRVSLLGAESGAHMTSLTIRAQMKTFIIVLLLTFALDGLIYGGILFYKSRVLKSVQKIEAGVSDLDKKIAKLEVAVLPAQDFQKLAGLAESLLERHLHWTRLLTLLEKRALTEVQFINMNVVESGLITTDIVARDYTTIAKQILMFESDPQIDNAVIANVSAQFAENGLLSGANTSFTIEFNPQVLTTSAEKESVQELSIEEVQ